MEQLAVVERRVDVVLDFEAQAGDKLSREPWRV